MADKAMGTGAITAASTFTGAEKLLVDQSGNTREGTLSSLGVIETFTFAGSTSTYTTGTIPTGYQDLELIVVCRSSAAVMAEGIRVRMNGITSATYDDQQTFQTGSGTATGGENLSNTYWNTTFVPGSTAPASTYGFIRMNLFQYNQTGFYKYMDCTGRQQNSTTTGSSYNLFISGQCRTTAAITTLTVMLATGNFTSGSRLILRGR